MPLIDLLKRVLPIIRVLCLTVRGTLRQERLKKLNDNQECNGHKNLRKPDGGRTTLRVWWVPAFEGVEEQVEVAESDIPF
jgi:hypothetical protein